MIPKQNSASLRKQTLLRTVSQDLLPVGGPSSSSAPLSRVPSRIFKQEIADSLRKEFQEIVNKEIEENSIHSHSDQEAPIPNPLFEQFKSSKHPQKDILKKKVAFHKSKRSMVLSAAEQTNPSKRSIREKTRKEGLDSNSPEKQRKGQKTTKRKLLAGPLPLFRLTTRKTMGVTALKQSAIIDLELFIQRVQGSFSALKAQHDLPRAINKLLELSLPAVELNSPGLFYPVLLFISDMLRDYSLLDTAFCLLHQIFKMTEFARDDCSKVKIYIKMSEICLRIKMYKQGILLLQKALEISWIFGLKSFELIIYDLLGYQYFMDNKCQIAEYYHKKSFLGELEPEDSIIKQTCISANKKTKLVDLTPEGKPFSGDVTYEFLYLVGFNRDYCQTVQNMLADAPLSSRRMYKFQSETVDERPDFKKKLEEGLKGFVTDLPESKEPFFPLQQSDYFDESIEEFLKHPKLEIFYTPPFVTSLNRENETILTRGLNSEEKSVFGPRKPFTVPTRAQISSMKQQKSPSRLHTVTFHGAIEDNKEMIKPVTSTTTGLRLNPVMYMTHQSPNRNVCQFDPSVSSRAADTAHFFGGYFSRCKDCINRLEEKD